MTDTPTPTTPQPREATAGGVTEAIRADPYWLEDAREALNALIFFPAQANEIEGRVTRIGANRLELAATYFTQAIAFVEAALPHIARPAGDAKMEKPDWSKCRDCGGKGLELSDGRWIVCERCKGASVRSPAGDVAEAADHRALAKTVKALNLVADYLNEIMAPSCADTVHIGAATLNTLQTERDAAHNRARAISADRDRVRSAYDTVTAELHAICIRHGCPAGRLRTEWIDDRLTELAAERDQARRELDVQKQHVRSAIERAGRYQADRDALATQLAEYQRTLADPIAVGVNIRRGTIARPADLVWLHDSEGPVAELEAALREIKLLALTAGGKGQISTPAALSRMVRLCIDAGIVEHLPQLAEKRP